MSSFKSCRTAAGAGLLIALGLAGCGDDVAIIDARPPVDAPAPGQAAVRWTIGHNNMPLTCAAIGATTIGLEIAKDGDAFGVVDSFACDAAMGTTRMLVPGLYRLRMSVSGVGGDLDGPEEIRDVIVPPGGTVNVPSVAFDVDPVGGMTFRITTGTIGNCTPVAQNGAGITAVRLELRDRTNTCVPATFTIAAGASQPAGTYASDCVGNTYGCIATDQDVTVSGLRSGPYSMIMTGSVGAAACWRRQPNAVVPAAGKIAMLPPQQLVLATGVPGCPMP